MLEQIRHNVVRTQTCLTFWDCSGNMWSNVNWKKHYMSFVRLLGSICMSPTLCYYIVEPYHFIIFRID